MRESGAGSLISAPSLELEMVTRTVGVGTWKEICRSGQERDVSSDDKVVDLQDMAFVLLRRKCLIQYCTFLRYLYLYLTFHQSSPLGLKVSYASSKEVCGCIRQFSAYTYNAE